MNPVEALMRTRAWLTKEQLGPDHRTVTQPDKPEWERFYRDRWAHDKVVRTTHGVNCTGSCAWNVYVKDGLITWEHQFTDYPSAGPDSPEYEPRGCPRGASFSWYTYSPGRVRYPYVRQVLLDLYRSERAQGKDPVEAWAAIVESPAKALSYKRARGKGGFVRATWEEAQEIQAAAHVHTIKRYGPDRIAAFTPIPAMSMVSFCAGTRLFSLLGATLLSFYDWYCDLPPASPQIWGDQTDVPESADWFNSSYIMMWGSNVPVTRTPDAHFMTEARYKGAKVVAVAPDYAENVKFADDWLAPAPGTDGALAFAMGHVVLRDFHRDRRVDRFEAYVKKYTDAPFLVRLEPAPGGVWRPGKFLTADAVPALASAQHAAFRPVLFADRSEQAPELVAPNGTLGDRWGDAGEGRWNLDLEDLDPQLSLFAELGPAVEIELPRFDLPGPDGSTDKGRSVRRGVPVRTVATTAGEALVTTVFDLMMAHYGVERPGLPGQWPTGPEDVSAPGTPSWAEAITGVPATQVERIAREFARNAEVSGGRSMIIMGAGANHYFHSDTIYRCMIALVTLTGCQGINGGGWAHYVGQEKARPITGQQHIGFALDWARPPRHQAGTSFWYTHSDQWRYDKFGAGDVSSPTGPGTLDGKSMIDCLAQAVRAGWTPGHPGFNRNPLDLAGEAEAAGRTIPEHVVAELRSGALRFAVEDPDDPANFPRCLTMWRANLLGNSAKGSEYFLRHLLGTDSAVTAEETRSSQETVWRDPAPEGKLDLVTTIDFRMTGSALLSDIVLPAATWYEKHDISTTDMHPFIHSFNPAIAPPWQARTDYQAFGDLADKIAELAATHLGTRTDVVPVPLLTDTPDELASPHGIVQDWKTGQTEPVPGVTMPKLVVVERDYTDVGRKWRTLGPLISKLGTTTKGVTVPGDDAVRFLSKKNGTADGSPLLDTDVKMADAIMALSGTTNGLGAVAGFKALERRTGKPLADLAEESEDRRITFADLKLGPQPVMTSYEWSGSETDGRRYSAFVINVERDRPWSTLTGRQQFYIDHDWMTEFGEGLPVYRPPLDLARIYGPIADRDAGAQVTVRYLTPHSKWSIHSSYADNPYMLALSRGGPVIWMSLEDAGKIGAGDNDWIEAYNSHGVVTARAVVSHRMPTGTVFMYHAKDRNVAVPLTQRDGRRGGTNNALTRLYIKPTHLIGGYAQLTFGFNYYGPTGNQRDELTVIRRRSQEVKY
ncbi:MAG: nitrate reductase subunit alpha [Bifidobacteriaceae bacterium]|jgi:nitrate reductase alpha subunit|nr:nitrate reductase subunit alpha [Bifidobacteriaceae bacterium]